MIRVIGEYSQENDYSLILDDGFSGTEKVKAARLMIVEPQVLIPTTQIVKTFPCARNAFLGH